ncbi:MAG: glycoside hydrolase family 16 protein [Chloroflexi bacterium]|nr:glycoside hydrolase family 16 protein [Chloroflexota bacterium]
MRKFLAIVSLWMISLSLDGCLSQGLVQHIPIMIPARPTPAPTPTAIPPVTPIGQIGGWDLIFSDEFNGTALNTGRWTTCYWWGKQGCTIATNHELEWYQPDQVLVADGVLRLRAQPRTQTASDGKVYDYTSGVITSGRASYDRTQPVKFSFTYGYAEIRAKIPTGKGLWPAFWLLPIDHTSRPEIDVMEIIGDEPQVVHLRLHYLTADGERGDKGGKWIGPDFSAGWHTFAINWQPQALVWYVDGVERWRYTDQATIPAEPMYLLANLAVGGDWPGAPDASTQFPSDYQIDYVRVWQTDAAARPAN